MNKGNIIIVCGATGSGKTALAIELANLLNGQIISADSLAIYQKLDIGTAKPTSQELAQAVHHMVDIVCPFDSFSVSDYKQQALPIIDNLIACGKTPIVCGGTGYYINSLLYELSYGNTQANLQARQKYEQMASQQGNEKLFEVLKKIDPKTAEVLHFNDVKRVIRALEIYEATGKLKSQIVDEKIPRYNYTAVCIDYDRAKLYERINKRVDLMFEAGLANEISMLQQLGLNENCQSMQGIGYKELINLQFENMQTEQVREQIKQNSRRYAKRQITFFKPMPGLISLKPQSAKAMAKQVIDIIKNKK